jgi:hypothetical protein
MADARSEASPLGERFNLDAVVLGLASDLTQLRAGEISIEDARVRAELAKQIMNGIRLVVNAQKYLEQTMKPLAFAAARTQGSE